MRKVAYRKIAKTYLPVHRNPKKGTILFRSEVKLHRKNGINGVKSTPWVMNGIFQCANIRRECVFQRFTLPLQPRIARSTISAKPNYMTNAIFQTQYICGDRVSPGIFPVPHILYLGKAMTPMEMYGFLCSRFFFRTCPLLFL